MTNLQPTQMGPFLVGVGKRLNQLEFSAGGLLRPKVAVPALAPGVSLTAGYQNDLSRYGRRLVVWGFQLSLSSSAGGGVARLPLGYRPAGIIAFRDAGITIDSTGLVTAAAGPSSVGGSVSFTTAD